MKRTAQSVVLLIFMLLVIDWGGGAASYEGAQLLGCADEDRVLWAADPPQHGPDVEELQLRLQELGYYNGQITGIYDHCTQQSVVKFHKDRGMGAVSIVTLETWNALAQDIKAPPSSETKEPVSGDVKIIIDKHKNLLSLYVGGKLYKQYPVAIGKNNSPTPVGEFKVANKSYKSGGALGTRWMGLNVPWGSYGVHGTNKPWSIGRRASAGCIRMHNQHVEEIYPLVKIGTPVTIIGDYPPITKSEIKIGANSQSLIPVQYKLRDLGIYWGPADGRFGQMTAAAVRYFQLLNGLEPSGNLTEETNLLLEKGIGAQN
ncbi:MAG: peptidoglycan-binding protein [Bacillota bacterium]